MAAEPTLQELPAASPSATLSPTAIAVTVAIAHGANDAYSAFLHPLLPRIMQRLDLNIALAATLAMTLSLAASLVQPVMGHLADRHGRRAFVIGGPLLSGVFMSLIGVAPTFAILVACLALGGLGSAAFHPPGASLAGRAGEGRGGGKRLSFFSFGGSVGYAAGPLIAVGVVAAVGLEGMWIAMLPAIVLAFVLLRILPADPPAHVPPKAPGPREIVRLLSGPLGLVFGISAAGTFMQRVVLTMQPIVVNEAGGSEALGALTLSVYLGGQAIGSLIGGTLADRVDRRMLIVAITALSFPAHTLAFLFEPGTAPAMISAAFAGVLNMALLPPLVLTAQELLPGRAALGSSVAMGIAWATASVMVLGTGVLGDALGARGGALASVPVVLIGTLLALRLKLPPARPVSP
jgi:FSR family fosmidomycin resistance protein-like MFS transporter